VEAEVGVATAVKRKRKRNPTLIAVAVLVPLLIWGGFEFRDMLKHGPALEPGQAPRLGQLVGMDPEDVTRVELRSGGSGTGAAPARAAAKTLVLARNGKEWRLEQPIAAKADSTLADQMVKDLLEPNIDQVVADEIKDPKQYGLDKPELTVTLTGKGGQSKVLQTGLKDVRGTAVYAREASNPTLFLLSSFTIDNLKTKKPEDLRDKTVVAVDPDKVTRLTIQRPDGTVVVERRGKEDWALTQPYAAPAEKTDVNFTLTQLKDLKVEKFVAEQAGDLAKYGLSPAQITVTATGPTTQTLLLGNPVPNEQNVYAARQGEKQVFAVRKGAITDLAKSASDLRDKTLLSFKRDDAERLALSVPAGQVELQRDGQEWKVTKPFTGKAKSDKVDTLFFGLESVKGTQAIEEKPTNLARYGLDKPQVKVSVWLKGKSAPLELMIGKKAEVGTGYYARSSNGPTVFTIPEFTLSDLKVKPTDLKA
jgi:Domain of unknown function (DUF4340)